VSRTERWRPEDDPEYMAEMERAMRSLSWGCLLFIVAGIAAAIGILILGYFFMNVRFLPGYG